MTFPAVVGADYGTAASILVSAPAVVGLALAGKNFVDRAGTEQRTVLDRTSCSFSHMAIFFGPQGGGLSVALPG